PCWETTPASHSWSRRFSTPRTWTIWRRADSPQATRNRSEHETELPITGGETVSYVHSTRECTPMEGSGHVPQGTRRQPWRDRHPSVPRRLRAGGGHRRRVPARGPELGAPTQGGRSVPTRRARSSRSRLPVRRRGGRRGTTFG